MHDELPPNLIAQRDALVALVHDAFRDVRRGGVSWSETMVIDGNGTLAERTAARAADRDTHWSQLVNDANWKIPESWGGFAFLNDQSQAYYFAPTLVRCLLEPHPVISTCRFRRFYAYLDDRQRHAVARCIRFFIRRDEHRFRDKIAEVNRWMQEAGEPACTIKHPFYPAGEAHAWHKVLVENWAAHLDPSNETREDSG